MQREKLKGCDTSFEDEPLQSFECTRKQHTGTAQRCSTFSITNFYFFFYFLAVKLVTVHVVSTLTKR